MRHITEGPKLDYLKKSAQAGFSGDGVFGPGASKKFVKKIGNAITGKKGSNSTNSFSHWYIDSNRVKWRFDTRRDKWVSPTGEKRAGINAFNQARSRSSAIQLTAESEMTKKTNEGLGDLAHVVEKDHEIQMARAQLYKIAKHAIQLHDIMKGMDPDTDLEAWVQSKITTAADYVDVVYHYIDGMNAAKEEKMNMVKTAVKRVRDTGGTADLYKATLEAKMNTKYLKKNGLTGDKAKDSKAFAKPRGKMPPPTTVMKSKKNNKHDARGKIKDID
jgi:uncharacterized protein YeaO (DUF488 family)